MSSVARLPAALRGFVIPHNLGVNAVTRLSKVSGFPNASATPCLIASITSAADIASGITDSDSAAMHNQGCRALC